MNIDINIAIF